MACPRPPQLLFAGELRFNEYGRGPIFTGWWMAIMRFLLLLMLCALLMPAAFGKTVSGDATTTKPWELLAPLHVVKLDNDMTFLIYPSKRAPVISGVIRFDVGGKDEVPGKTGIAHMFEHMAFKGTQRIGTTDYKAERKALDALEKIAVTFDRRRAEIGRQVEQGKLAPAAAKEQLAEARKPFAAAQAAADKFVVKNEFDQIYDREGGSQMNASTSGDATTYFISLPANRLSLWMRMESERLTMPVMRQFYSERDVVMEERRMRQDNSPTGQLWEQMLAAAYTASPYGYPVIGFESDIQNLKANEAAEFFNTHYTPDRGIGVLVGDLDVAETEKMLRETFGKIPARREARSQHLIEPEPEQKGERRIKLELPASPTLIMGWHKPTVPSRDDVRAEVLAQVLTGGRSARWFESLVKQEHLAAEVSAFTAPGDALPNLFMIYATPQTSVTLQQLETRLRTEVAALAAKPVEAEELARAKKQLGADRLRALQDNLGLAQRLAESAQLSGDPWYLERRLREIENISAEELRKFTEEFLVDSNLTVGWLTPPKGK